MATKKKISIEEALRALETAGLKVKIEKVEDSPKPFQKPDFIIEEPIAKAVKQKSEKTPSGLMKATLFAQHQINGVTYGPGIVNIPMDQARTLLYQDRIAREADDRVFDKVSRCYLVAKRRDNSGNECNVGMRVPSLDFSFLSPNNYIEVR